MILLLDFVHESRIKHLIILNANDCALHLNHNGALCCFVLFCCLVTHIVGRDVNGICVTVDCVNYFLHISYLI